ncbi:MAG: hypothetical protein E7647_05740, partial [Ruminococcaceae bacterium]|nr:hypothetical protein [Oscillospiraceae bacterium]
MKTKKRITNRILSLVLSIVMVVSVLPMNILTVSAAETTEPAPVCDCGTDDPAIHATTCAVYVAPENPVCSCAEACGVETQNFWCDVCGFDYAKCTGTDTAVVYADEDYTYDAATNTYTVYTADGLFAVAELVNDGDYSANITLAADIVLNENLADKVTVAEDGTFSADDSVRKWTPIGGAGGGQYKGTFDGGNHTITGLYSVLTGSGYSSLIGFLAEGATVKNVKIHDFRLYGRGGGTVVGLNRGKVSGCSISGSGIFVCAVDISSTSTYFGGIVAFNYGTVENCSSSADLYFKGTGYFGGIVGTANSGSSVTGCYSSGTLEAECVDTLNVGGIVGNPYGDITDCHNSGDVYVRNTASNTAVNVYVGGIAGKFSGNAYSEECGNITCCSNSGSVEVVHDSTGSRAQIYVGGIVGQLSYASVTGCYNTGSLKAENRSENASTMYACGIGYSDNSTVTGCYNTGSVESDKASSAIRRGGTGTDCYYLDGCVKSGENVDSAIEGITAKTEAQFVSGEVAYLLNGDQSTITFKQTLLTDAYPGFTGGTVYQVENCKEEPVYSNTNENIDHNYVGAETAKPTCYAVGKMTYTCDVCGDSYEEEIKAYHDGNLEYHAAKDPVDCATPGNVEHWYCPGCDG